MLDSSASSLSGPVDAALEIWIRLNERASGLQPDPFVVTHYGDSHTQAGSLSNVMRRRLSASPVSPGFVTHQFPWSWNASVRRSRGWRRFNWLRDDMPPFGPMGIAFEAAKPNETLSLTLKTIAESLKDTRVTVLFDARDEHLPFEVLAGGQTLATVDGYRTKSVSRSEAEKVESSGHLGAVELVLPPGARELTLKTLGRSNHKGRVLRVYGFVIRYAESMLEWDTLGVGGTVIDNLMERGDEAIEEYLALRKPQLMVVWYGTNSLNDPDLNLEAYRSLYRRFLSRLANAAPRSACLAIGPPDFAKRDGACFLSSKQIRAKKWRRSNRRRKVLGKNLAQRICKPDELVNHSKRGRYRFPVPGVRTNSEWEAHKANCQFQTVQHMEALIAIQRDVAHEAGCLYFDAFAYMGGAGAMHKWACEEAPRLAAFDHVHLTRAGYERLGNAIIDELDSAIGRIPE